MATFRIIPTKEKILNIAVALFGKYGYNGTSLQQIADIAEIKKSSIYNYYESKDHILRQIYTAFTDEMMAQIPSKEDIKTEIEKSDSVEEFWKSHIRKQYEDSITSYSGRLWKVISQEQYKDERAGKLILKETERQIEFLTMIFKLMLKRNLIKKADPLQLATSFHYANQAIHLEFLILHTFDMDTTDCLKKAMTHADYFIGKIKKG